MDVEKKREFLDFLNIVKSELEEKLLPKAPSEYKEYWQYAEKETLAVIKERIKNTSFKDTNVIFQGGSNKHFPDILLDNLKIGIEIKSSSKWTVPGGSVFEWIKAGDLEEIFIIFCRHNQRCKKPIEVRVGDYKTFISDITVTHSPRFSIDMDLKSRSNDKILKDTLENKYPNEVEYSKQIAKYLNSKLKPGEVYWWSFNKEAESGKYILFSKIKAKSKNKGGGYEAPETYISQAIVLFPELFSNSSTKYIRVSKWFDSKKIICPNIRDLFTAGGKLVISESGIKLPHIFAVVKENQEKIREAFINLTMDELVENWEIDDCVQKNIIDTVEDRFRYWKNLVEQSIGKNLNSEMIKIVDLVKPE